MNKIIDLTNQKYGKLTAIHIIPKGIVGENYKWLFKCECGNDIITSATDVRSGHTKSCGCLRKIGNNYKHGQNRKGHTTSEYTAWAEMIKRCTKNAKHKKDYIGRGIKVCDRWLGSFENFFKDMGKKPSAKHSLDRFPNNDGNYEPNNCRWATSLQQNENKRSNKWITLGNETMLLRDWLQKYKIDRGDFYKKKKKHGYSHKEMIEFYINKKKVS